MSEILVKKKMEQNKNLFYYKTCEFFKAITQC